jgi:hypothetical protein
MLGSLSHNRQWVPEKLTAEDLVMKKKRTKQSLGHATSAAF